MNCQRVNENEPSRSTYSSVNRNSALSRNEKSSDERDHCGNNVFLPETRQSLTRGSRQNRGRGGAHWHEYRNTFRASCDGNGKLDSRMWNKYNGDGNMSHRLLFGRKTMGMSSMSSFSTTSMGSVSTYYRPPSKCVKDASADKREQGRRNGNGDGNHISIGGRTSVPASLPGENASSNLVCARTGTFVQKKMLLSDWLDQNRHIRSKDKLRSIEQWIIETSRLRLEHIEQDYTSEDSRGCSEGREKHMWQHTQSCDEVRAQKKQGEGVTYSAGCDEVQTTEQLSSVLEGHSKLVPVPTLERLREKRWREFASNRSSLAEAAVQNPTFNDSFISVKCCGNVDTSAATTPPAVDSELLIQKIRLIANADTTGKDLHEISKVDTQPLMKTDADYVRFKPQRVFTGEYREVVEMTNLSGEHIPHSSSTERASIVVKSSTSSPMCLQPECQEVANIMKNTVSSIPNTTLCDPGYIGVRDSSGYLTASTIRSMLSPSPATVLDIDSSDDGQDVGDVIVHGNESARSRLRTRGTQTPW